MASFDKNSALYGIEFDDVDSLRRIMNGVLHRLATVPAAQVVRQQGLNPIEEVVVEDIITATENNELFRQMATRFASAHDANTATVLREAQVFETITPPSVRGTTNFPSQQAIADARTAFRDFVDNGSPFEYEEEEVDGGTADQDVVMGEGAEPEDGEEEDLETDKQVKASESQIILSLKRKKTENTPVRAKDVRITDDGSAHDRTIRAEVNKENPNLLTLSFEAEKQDPEDKRPKDQRRWIPTDPVVYDYMKIKPGFLWTSPEWVSKLNKWRYQILNRNVGPEGQSKWQWTVAEETIFYRLLREYLPSVNGQYSRIDWGDVADRFNAQMRGHRFTKADLTAVSQYKKGADIVITASHPVATEHDFQPRSGKALKTQLDKFTSSTAKKILSESKKADKDSKKIEKRHTSTFQAGRPQTNLSDSNTAKGKGKEPAQEIEGSDVGNHEGGNSSESSLSPPPEGEGESDVEMGDDDSADLQQVIIDSTQEANDDEALREALAESQLDIDEDDDEEELQRILKKPKREQGIADRKKTSGGESSKQA